MPLDMSHLPIILLALIAGVAIETGGVCAVRAAKEAADGRVGQFASALMAATAAGLALVAARAGGAVEGVGHAAPALMAVTGALVFALGARLNGACAIGTVSRLAEGDLAYLGTLAGAALAASLVAPTRPKLDAVVPTLGAQGLWVALMVLTTVGLVLAALRGGQRPAWRSFVVVGVTGGLLAASGSRWAWIDLAYDLAHRAAINPHAALAGGALFLGAIAAAAWRGRLRLRLPKARRLVRDTVGGALMMAGGLLLPGGNDGLVLYGVPGGSPRAVLGWAALLAALTASFAVPRLRRALAT